MMDCDVVAFDRATRRGAVRREVRERYARDDLPRARLRGRPFSDADFRNAAAAATARGEAVAWIVPDTNARRRVRPKRSVCLRKRVTRSRRSRWAAGRNSPRGVAAARAERSR